MTVLSTRVGGMWKCGLVFLVAISVDYFWDGFCSKSMRRIVKKIQAKGQLSNNGDRKNQLSNIGSQLAREIHAGRFKWFRFTYFLKCLCYCLVDITIAFSIFFFIDRFSVSYVRDKALLYINRPFNETFAENTRCEFTICSMNKNPLNRDVMCSLHYNLYVLRYLIPATLIVFLFSFLIDLLYLLKNIWSFVLCPFRRKNILLNWGISTLDKSKTIKKYEASELFTLMVISRSVDPDDFKESNKQF